MTKRLFVSVVLACATASAADAPNAVVRLNLRTRVQPFKGTGEWQEAHLATTFPVGRTAILICDMWDNHWCTGASRRVGELAARMEPVIEAARAHGIQIIHSPSEVMDFYKGAPQRLRMLTVPKIDPPGPAALNEPPLTIDDSNVG